MNERFYLLPKEKQRKIINAAYRVFSRSSYRKSSMQEIADFAGISKSLLFHYFRNKKELYLFLWDEGARVTLYHLTKAGCYDITDLFEAMYRGMQAKLAIMRRYPDMTAFILRAFYEKDPDVVNEVQKLYEKALNMKAMNMLLRVNPDEFREGLDLEMMYREMYWAAEGYLWENIQTGTFDADAMERDFTRMLRFWKSVYLRNPAAEDAGEERNEKTEESAKTEESEKNDDESAISTDP